MASAWPAPNERPLLDFIAVYSTSPKLRSFLANINSRSRSLYAIARLSICRLSVTLVRSTQAVQIFGNISTAFDTLAIR